MNTDWKQIADERSVTIRSLIKEHVVMRKQLDIALEALERVKFYANTDWSHTQLAEEALAKIKEVK